MAVVAVALAATHKPAFACATTVHTTMNVHLQTGAAKEGSKTGILCRSKTHGIKLVPYFRCHGCHSWLHNYGQCLIRSLQSEPIWRTRRSRRMMRSARCAILPLPSQNAPHYYRWGPQPILFSGELPMFSGVSGAPHSSAKQVVY